MTRQRRGRRPGAADTRGEILAAARRMFAEKGFDKTTIRGIAAAAGVDPALVHHYFDTKEGVFVAAMRLPLDPAVELPAILSGPREEIGERVVRFVLRITGDPRAREQILALLRTAMVNEQVAVMLREFFSTAVLGRIAGELGIPPIRLQAAFAQMLGVVINRHILGMEPIATADVEELVALLAPTLQRYLGEQDPTRA